MRRLILAYLLVFASITAFAYQAEMKSDHFYVIVDECLREQVPLSLVMSLIEEESGFDPFAKGRRNYNGTVDYGYMQLNSKYIPWFIDRFGYEDIKWDPIKNPEHNLRLGIRYLSYLRNRFKSWPETLYAYNWGPTNLRLTPGDLPNRVVVYASSILQRIRTN